MIALVDVCKSFNGRPVLNKMSLAVQKNEVAGILGRSGCGKTTILKLVAGFICPDSGLVKIGSKKIGYVFQEHRLIPWKTAMENVCFSLKASGCATGKSRKIAGKYIQKMGLAGFEDHYPAQLSGGMCQRVSIARAFAVKPDILLMDEPFSALDLELKNGLLAIVHEMLRDHHSMTVLYVTHNPEELKKIAHKIYTLSEDGLVDETASTCF